MENFKFEYDHDEMDCFFDQQNQRIAFVTPDEILLIIDMVDGHLTFHPGEATEIVILGNDTYRIISND